MPKCTVSYINRGASRTDREFENALAFVDESGALLVMEQTNDPYAPGGNGVVYCRAPAQWIWYKNTFDPPVQEEEDAGALEVEQQERIVEHA